MVECQKCLDPTSFGLFLVAVVSLPLAIYQLLNDGSVWNMAALFTVGGILMICVAWLAYHADSNFGFVVFGLVGFGVLITGLTANNTMGSYVCLTFALVYVLAFIWSIVAKTPKTLSLILVTTTLIFLTVGLSGIIGGDYWHWLIGISALLNFLFNIYLSFALALDGKIPVV